MKSAGMERANAAGNLMAELYDAKDRWRQGRIPTAQYLERVKVIHNRARSWSLTWAPTNGVRPEREQTCQ
jgi:hypothetical protein